MNMNGDIAELLGGELDTSNDPADIYEPIPPGWYTAMIENAEIKDTKAGNGKYLNIQFNIYGEQFDGRKIFTRINLANPNQKAVEIGARELAQLASACGLLRLADSAELLDRTLQIKVAVVDGLNGDKDNDVKGFKPVNDGTAPAAPVQQAATPAAQAAPPPPPMQAPAAPAPAPAQTPQAPKRKYPWER